GLLTGASGGIEKLEEDDRAGEITEPNGRAGRECSARLIGPRAAHVKSEVGHDLTHLLERLRLNRLNGTSAHEAQQKEGDLGKHWGKKVARWGRWVQRSQVSLTPHPGPPPFEGRGGTHRAPLQRQPVASPSPLTG